MTKLRPDRIALAAAMSLLVGGVCGALLFAAAAARRLPVPIRHRLGAEQASPRSASARSSSVIVFPVMVPRSRKPRSISLTTRR